MNPPITNEEIALAAKLAARQLDRIEGGEWCSDMLIEQTLDLLDADRSDRAEIDRIVSAMEDVEI